MKLLLVDDGTLGNERYEGHAGALAQQRRQNRCRDRLSKPGNHLGQRLILFYGIVFDIKNYFPVFQNHLKL